MFSGLESPMHLLIILVIAMLVFGPKRLPELGRSLGSGIRGFKGAIEGKDEAPAEELPPEQGTGPDATATATAAAATPPKDPGAQ
ncbi:MAG: twin-arginine translocase TatA/TatE family subunit [Actinobacteria bacterium]|nr:twin-arginine translocase TatA/TatE family subunit [Actinomycetota bacterium]